MDDAFLAALAANFDDETTRLVYADWLDERGDPRGPFLRAEVEWARLHLDDEAFPPALARLSIAQRGIDAEWVERVSRLPALVRQTWETVAARFTKLDQSVIYQDWGREWRDWVEDLYATFCHHLRAASVAQRFCVPADYDAFMSTIGGGWRAHVTLWDAALMRGTTAENCVQFKDFYRGKRGLWLNIGECSFYSLFLCCDSTHHMFGHVLERRSGAHPWFDDPESMTLPAPIFLHHAQPDYELNKLLDSW
jgi:uncharacterized protein (TIGR02996 family)